MREKASNTSPLIDKICPHQSISLCFFGMFGFSASSPASTGTTKCVLKIIIPAIMAVMKNNHRHVKNWAQIPPSRIPVRKPVVAVPPMMANANALRLLYR